MTRKPKEAREPEFATEVRLQDIAYGGETVARIKDPGETTAENQPENETVVFVAGGVPGELVDIQLYRRKKSFLRGNVVRLLETSPDRRDAPCPWFGVDKWPNCGGCQWQHTNYSRQLEFKNRILHDQFTRLGGLPDPPLLEPRGALSEWGYRNNVEFQMDDNNRPCFHRQNSIRLVPVESCHIAHPLITLAIEPLTLALATHLPNKVHQVTIRVAHAAQEGPVLAEEISALSPKNEDKAARLHSLERFAGQEPLAGALGQPRPSLMFILRMLGQWTVQDLAPFTQQLQAALDPYTAISILAEGKKRRLELLCGQPYLEENLAGINYRVPPLGFFQSNSPMAEVLVREVLDTFTASGLKLKGARLLDLYCGVGTFGLQLARFGAKVLGIEEYEGAIEFARENARLNDLDKQTEFIAAKAEEYILELAARGEKFDAVLVDPPRRGCDPLLLQSLLKTRPPILIYVSCDPSTLARDTKILAEGYRLVQSRVVDMFPQTYHMESVSLFQSLTNS